MAAQPQGTRAKGKKRAAPMPATGNQAPRPARRRRNIPAAAGSSDALAMSSGSQDGPSLADNASSTQSVPSVADMFAEMKTMMSTMVTLIAGQHNVRNDGPNVGVGGGINAVAQPHGSVVTMQPGHGLSSTIHPYNPIQSSHSVQPASNLGDPTAASPSMNLHVQQPGNMEHCNATAIHLNGPLLGQVTGTAVANAVYPVGSPSYSARDRNGSMISAARPLYYGVPDKVKERVWAGKYVDFHDFQTPSYDKPQRPRSTIISTDGDGEPITLSIGRERKDRPLSIFQWLSCFDIFASVHCMKTPGDAQRLMRYSALIKEICDDGGDWRFYDESFRRWREEEPLEWSEIAHVLLYKAHSRGRPEYKDSDRKGSSVKKSHAQSFRPGQSSASFPRGSCWRFQKHGKCVKGDKCAFPHTCTKCQGSHPSFQCRHTPTFKKDSAKPSDSKQQSQK
ncbi:uncharacterized protein LOC135499832 isoform X1 [Lineus longissimus]|uniref:uncharacterized protein LOC135499832 isoform X1 n=1 Tax=Lineus longissimus TaxID=88925 RepID=UPI00315D804A